ATAPTTAAEARPLASRRRRLMRATVASSVRFLRCAVVRERASPAYSCRGPRARAVGCWSAAVGSRSGFSFVAGGVWQAGGGDVVAGVAVAGALPAGGPSCQRVRTLCAVGVRGVVVDGAAAGAGSDDQALRRAFALGRDGDVVFGREVAPRAARVAAVQPGAVFAADDRVVAIGQVG